MLFDKDAAPFVNYPTKSQYGQGYRYPSPASREKVNVPTVPSKDAIYDIKYYTRDVARNQEPVKIIAGNSKRYLIDEKKHPNASPGRKNEDVERYDPTGTRSAMTTTQAAVDKELKKHRSSHLPRPFWTMDGSETLEEEAKRKNLPPLIGRRARWSVSPATYEVKKT